MAKKEHPRAKYQNHVKNYVGQLDAVDKSMIEYEDLDKDTQNKVKQEAYFGHGPNPTPSQKAARVRYVENMRLGGFTKREVIYYCIHNWGVARNNAVNYYKEALSNFEQDFREDFDKEVDYHLEIRWKLYKEALKSGKLDTAQKMLIDIAKIEGVYEYKPSIRRTDTEFNEMEEYLKENVAKVEEQREEE